jgi:hypothetical protein
MLVAASIGLSAEKLAAARSLPARRIGRPHCFLRSWLDAAPLMRNKATSPTDATPKGGQRQVLHDLSEKKSLSLVHRRISR